MWLTYLSVAAGTAAGAGSPAGTEIFQIAIGAINLGVLGWLCWMFVQDKLHSDGEMERAAAAAAKSVEAARMDLLRENERLIAEKAAASDKADAALGMAQDRLVPLLTSFVATSQSLIPLLQELVRSQRGSPLAGNEEAPGPLSPKVAQLLKQVKAKVAVAPTLAEIRDLADRALAEARENSLTVAEIGQLADEAVRKAREVEACAARLAELLSGVTDG